jgi:hypothetical protein
VRDDIRPPVLIELESRRAFALRRRKQIGERPVDDLPLCERNQPNIDGVIC